MSGMLTKPTSKAPFKVTFRIYYTGQFSYDIANMRPNLRVNSKSVVWSLTLMITHPRWTDDHSPSMDWWSLTLDGLMITHPRWTDDHSPSMDWWSLTLDGLMITHPRWTDDHSRPSMDWWSLTLDGLMITHPRWTDDHSPSMDWWSLTLDGLMITHPRWTDDLSPGHKIVAWSGLWSMD